MRKVMLLFTEGDGEVAREVIRELNNLYYEVLDPREANGNQLKDIEQADLFVLVSRKTAKLEGLARTLLRDELLSGIPRLIVTEEKALAEFDYCRLADEILLFPFRRAELGARMKILTWRNEKVDASNVVQAGSLSINLSIYEVTVEGALVELTFKEYELLCYLVTHRRRVHTRRELLSRVWGEDYYGGPRTVDVHIRRIRSKIETGGRAYIQTVRGVGYRFTD
ncbi:MAG: hypothetical protein A2Z86_09150 [Candidatus Glassbacteria bacterium GWA2_58_10]|uniref:OmpR/PhoB-type domain-containing protein n=1 Tax=Candidatus Glassbacteria bacterium GWA2_58_10 TaxID=1817865 RepID=A0A1F5YE29_9BACT|nr:MAG: hypothetical protein A2Z86_09150 [Candidatus Glassbacteria bacterium GWA2_58_10]